MGRVKQQHKYYYLKILQARHQMTPCACEENKTVETPFFKQDLSYTVGTVIHIKQ